MRIVASLAAAVLAFVAVFTVGTSSARDGGFAAEEPADRRLVRAQGNFSLADARTFARFPLYSLGDSFDGLPLVASLRAGAEARAGETVGADHVTFVYGTCESIAGAACQPPLQVQVWNACVRNRASYDIPADETLELRGVPAAFYERWSRLELFTRDATIVVFADTRDRGRLLRAADLLRGVNRDVELERPLRPSDRARRCTTKDD